MDETKAIYQSNKSKDHIISVGGAVDRVRISLRFRGDDLDPNELSALLKCQPTKAYRKGDILSSKRSHRFAHTGFWMLEGAKEETGDLETKITRLLNRVEVPLPVWEKLADFRGDIFCGLFLNDWNRGLSLSPNLRQRLAERNLSIDFDIYCPLD